jgi:hypothetical protein
LVDALWISLFGPRPGNNIPTASLVLGLIGLTSVPDNGPIGRPACSDHGGPSLFRST